MLAVLVTSTLLAGAPGLELSWEAAEGCPGPAELERELEYFLLGPTTPGEEVRATGHVHRAGPSFVLELDISAPGIDEHHRVSSPRCMELSRLAALLIAGVLEPLVLPRSESLVEASLIVERPQAPSESEARPSISASDRAAALEAKVEESTPPTEPTLRPEPRGFGPLAALEPEVDAPEGGQTAWSVLVRAVGFGALNLLPGPGGGVELGLAADRGHLRLGLAGSGWFGPGFRAPDAPEVGGDLWAWSAELSVCGVPGWRRLEFPLCASFGAGQVRGRGVGVPEPDANAQPWLVVGADAGLDWWLAPRFALLVGVGFGASLLRPSFAVAGSSASYEVPVVLGRAQLGIAARFGAKTRPELTRVRRPPSPPRRSAGR